ncbi:unnamed protein product [Dracunculus medinensis]|uniref:Uncharacterized protein n=1 Tax=Dracunculus medinensis TaxID=318479 RepID=A0A0N4UEH2_DRAME|nr:unnamed protein product [Dracunculus medinensis]
MYTDEGEGESNDGKKRSTGECQQPPGGSQQPVVKRVAVKKQLLEARKQSGCAKLQIKTNSSYTSKTPDPEQGLIERETSSASRTSIKNLTNPQIRRLLYQKLMSIKRLTVFSKQHSGYYKGFDSDKLRVEKMGNVIRQFRLSTTSCFLNANKAVNC